MFKAPEEKETNPQADNIIGQLPEDDTSKDNCGQEMPYFDGQSCILCQKPFLYFDLESKTCVNCDSEKIYDS